MSLGEAGEPIFDMKIVARRTCFHVQVTFKTIFWGKINKEVYGKSHRCDMFGIEMKTSH